MSAYSDAVLADGPVAYWRLDETSGTNANDAGSNNLDGTYTGGYTLNQSSLLLTDTNPSVALDGVAGSYVTVPDNNLLDLGDGPLTLECWVKRANTTVDGGLISKTGAGGPRVSFTADGNVSFTKAGTSIAQTTGAPLNDTNAHHVVVTKNGAAVKVYVNGIDMTPTITNQTLGNTAAQLLLGSLTTTISPLNGRLDEVAIYASVLSQAQVLNHYLLGRSAKFGSASFSGSGSLTAAPVRVRMAGASLSGEGTMSATPLRVRFASAAFSGIGSLVAVARGIFAGRASFSGTGTLSVTPAGSGQPGHREPVSPGHIERVSPGHRNPTSPGHRE